jgi:uncharacterized protein (TIGR03437 family)
MEKTLLFRNLVCLGIMGLAPLSAQTPIFMSAGYTTPTPMVVSPGQVITLYVSGTKTILPSQSPSIRATTIPLPTKLGGFSVTVRQGNNTYAAPLLSVVQTPNCTDSNQTSPDCITTALTLQIPFEIAAVTVLTQAAQLPGNLSVNDNGVESGHFPIAAITDNIHVLTICDIQTGFPFLPSPCPALVTHADGTIVFSTSPASAGETVVLYAYGLGATTPAVKAGEASPTPAPVVSNGPNFKVQFDFRPNARASIPYLAQGQIPTPAFVGLTPGQVGLYQINVKIPATVPAIPSCSVYFDCLNSLIGCLIQSNTTINIAGVSSFDGAAICVQPPQ